MLWRLVMIAGSLGACGRSGFDTIDRDGDAVADSIAVDDAAPDASVRHNLAFVTSTTHEPQQLGGLAGADAICAARASEGGHAGNFVALLGTSAAYGDDRLLGARGWVLFGGQPIADTVADLDAATLIDPIDVDEHGQLLTDGGHVATGQMVALNCTDWTITGGSLEAGLAFMTGGSWTNRLVDPCTRTDEHLYCFQRDFDTPLVIKPVTGRRAFVSVGAFTPNTGRAAADAICTSEASGAGLSGTFRALLTDGIDPASARFDTLGATWVRMDGVPLAETADDVMNGRVLAPVLFSAGGVPNPGTVMTGADGPTVVTGGEDCAGWTTTSGGANYGYSDGAAALMFNATSATCTASQSVYCFEL